ncbi:MAG: C40 family peptidase [Actinobacteria bacterium]|nr:C40 family peptidase [Actinomycetota bacterium]
MGRRSRVVAVLAAAFALVVGIFAAVPVHAEPGPSAPPGGPNPPGGNAPTVPGAVTPSATDYFGPPPPDCPTTVAANATFARAVDWRRLCLDAVALAPTYEAERAIKWAFARLGAPYDVSNRTTTGFDCSSFVGRAFNAAGAPVTARNGVQYDFFPYFGWTGAYVPTSSPISRWGGGYEGTNVVRVARADLRPGDIIIQFFGTDPSKSAGNQGHAKIYLGSGRVIEAGGAAQVRADLGWMDTGSYFTNEWYFRYQSVGAEKPGYSTQLAPGTYRMKVGAADETVIGNLTVVAPRTQGHTRVFTCGRPMPLASNTQFAAGRTTATLAAVQLDGDGNVCVYLTSYAHLIWDQVWSESNVFPPPPESFTAHEPVRKLDTRGPTFVPAGGIVEVDTGFADHTVMATLTVLDPQAPGHTRVFPCDVDGTPGTDQPPNASTSNYTDSRVANFATVRSDSTGKVCVYTSAAAHLLWDQVLETADIVSEPPERLYDSRLASDNPIANNGGLRLDPVDPQQVVRIDTGVPGAVVIGNLTATDALGPAHVRTVSCWDPNQESPASVLNFPAQSSTSNAVLAQADFNGEVCFKVKQWTHLIWDQAVTTDALGYNSVMERMMDSRQPFFRPVRV